MAVEIIYKKVGDDPYVCDLFTEAKNRDEIEASQILVGGWIEVTLIAGQTFLVCNEEGLLDGLPENSCGIVGNFFIVNADKESGSFCSLSEDDKRRAFKWFEANKGIPVPEEPHYEVITMSEGEWANYFDQEAEEQKIINENWYNS